MTDEQMRIRIAEACRWKKMTYKDAKEYDPTIIEFAGWDDPVCCSVWVSPNNEVYSYDIFRLPDYLNDLNAMHEAVKYKFSKGSRDLHDFEAHLQFMCDYPTEATARQRAEAFLKTIGKWEENNDR
jgi:hypothetical protein